VCAERGGVKRQIDRKRKYYYNERDYNILFPIFNCHAKQCSCAVLRARLDLSHCVLVRNDRQRSYWVVGMTATAS